MKTPAEIHSEVGMTVCIKCGELFSGSFTGECKDCELKSITNFIVQSEQKTKERDNPMPTPNTPETNAATPRTDAWCELAMNADVSAVLNLAKQFEREQAPLHARIKLIERELNEANNKVTLYEMETGLDAACKVMMSERDQLKAHNEMLVKRLSQHDGCSRYCITDARLLKQTSHSDSLTEITLRNRKAKALDWYATCSSIQSNKIDRECQANAHLRGHNWLESLPEFFLSAIEQAMTKETK